MSSIAASVRQSVVGGLFLLLFSSVLFAQAPTPSYSKFDTGRPSPVLAGGAPGTWDEVVREKVSVMYDGGIYKMWYCGHVPENFETGQGQDTSSQIGYATSSDGITWTRYAGNPVFGAAQFRAGTDQDMDVLKVGATYYMFIETGNYFIDLATSSDGVTWTAYAGNPLLTAAASPAVLREGSIWYMFYEDMSLDQPAINLATSPNGLTWTPSPANPVLAEATATTVPDSIVKEGSTYHLYYHREQFGIWPAYHATSTNLTTWTNRTLVSLLSSQRIFQHPNGQIWGYFWDLPALTDRQMYLRYGLNITAPSVWHADEGTGTSVAEASGSLAHGELYNGVTWTSGHLGTGLHFDGVNDYAHLGNYANNPAWTVAGWVRSPSAPNNGTASGPIDRNANFRFTWNHPDPAFRGAASLRVAGTWHVASFGTLPANTWVHLAATYDGETLRSYVNGAPVSSNTAPSGAPDLDPSPLTLGRYADLPQYFLGDVDEVYLNSRALSDTEIAGLTFSDSTPPSAPTLTAQASGQAVNLSWTAATDAQSGVTSYRIYRSIGIGQTKTFLTQVNAPALSYQDAAVTGGTTYAYQVAAVNGATIEGARSNEASATPVNTAPAAPTGLVGTSGNQQAVLDWNNNGEADLAGYHVYRATASGGPFTRITPSPIATSAYTNTGLTNGTTYFFRVTAIDTGTLESTPSSTVSVTPSVAGGGDGSLQAHWRLDETSGTTASDSSGNARHGTVAGGAVFSTGVLSNALTFDGANDVVTTPLSFNFASWTVSLWVRSPTAPSASAVSGPIHSDNLEINWNHPTASVQGSATVRVGWNWYGASFGPLSGNTWYHLVATYDGENLRTYKNGALITTNAQPSGPSDAPLSTTFTMGRHSTASQFFTGSLDDVRVYNRALSLSEVAALGQTDATPPSTPTLNATASGQSVNLSWTAATDAESGVSGYRIYRSIGVGQPKTLLTTVGASPLTYQDSATAANTTYAYRIAAVNGGGIEGTQSNEASATTVNAAPAAPTGLVDTPGNQQAVLDWANNSEGDLAGYHVYRATASGGPFARITTSPIVASAYTNTGLTNGTTYFYRVTAIDTGSLESVASSTISVVPAAPSGDSSLQAHWRFDETSGTTAADASSFARTATVAGGAVWAAGQFGNSLTFDGVNDVVTTPLGTDMNAWTVSLWVRSPTAPNGGVVSGPIHAANMEINWNHPVASVQGSATVRVGWNWYGASFGPLAANTWYHLVATYDGENLRTYKNGVIVATNAQPSGAPDVAGSTLTIGKHSTAAQFFTGSVDNVRVYNRALSDSEVTALTSQP
jgi:fibronectin type 3 domain-containing protein